MSDLTPLFSDTTAKAVYARPRGFIDVWNPHPETRLLIAQIGKVLADYADQLPLTARQSSTAWSPPPTTRRTRRPTSA